MHLLSQLTLNFHEKSTAVGKTAGGAPVPNGEIVNMSEEHQAYVGSPDTFVIAKASTQKEN